MKDNGSKFKLYLVETVTANGSTTTVDKLITEQISLSISNTTNTIDVTSKDNDGHEQFIGGLKSGEISCEIIMDTDVSGAADKVNQIDMQSYQAARLVKTYKAKYNDGKNTLSFLFSALVTKFDISAPMEDKITVSMTLKRSGAPTQTITPNP